MEDVAALTAARTARVGSLVGIGFLAAALATGLPLSGSGAAENAPAEVRDALRALGAPGFLWGRVAVEEESPDGAWTPLPNVEVHAYPATPAIVTELDRIRATARDSGTQFDTAISRVQAALGAYRAHVEVASRGQSLGGAGGPVRRQVTDPAGLFAFDDLPSGDWLLVAIRVSPYARQAGPTEPRRNASRERFLPPSGEAPKEAELWVRRVRLAADARVGLLLTDRARWLVGPVR